MTDTRTHAETAPGTGWPGRLRPGAIRWVRTSDHYEATIAFYRDLIRLPVIGEFSSSYGEDGTIFGLPDTTVEMEIVRSRSDQPTTIAAFDQLVFYLDDVDAVTAATASLREAGLRAEPEPHAYWAANGAVVHHDPDGRDVVFAPWVFGRDPEPAERAVDASADQAADVPDAGQRIPSQPGLRIEEYDGPRDSLRFLFELAEDSPRQLDSYLDAGRVLVARSGGRIVGHLQLVPTGQADQAEIKNMAVLEEFRGQGIGRALVEVALRLLADAQVRDVLVGTAAADVGNLRFYQRCGFRLRSIEPDAFTPATGYPDPIRIDGIPLWDRVWLARDA